MTRSLVFVCVQGAGRGGRTSEDVSADSVPQQFVKRVQHQRQSDDLVLQQIAGAAVSSAARAPCPCVPLLLRHAGRGHVCPLGLEELRRTDASQCLQVLSWQDGKHFTVRETGAM